MAQFNPKTHRARDLLEETGRRLPYLWSAAEKIRLEFPQPEVCFLTDHAGGQALVLALEMAGEHRVLDSLRRMSPIEISHAVMPGTTLACWRMTQGIYRIDPALYPALIDTPPIDEVPMDMLMHLPEWCVYVETPGLTMPSSAGTPIEVPGFWARLDHDGSRYLLSASMDTNSSNRIINISLPLMGSISSALEESMREWGGGTPEKRALIRPVVTAVLNLLLYIVSTTDISGKRGEPGNPVPVRTRRHGWRMFPADGPRMWNVGVRMGSALRRAYEAESIGYGSEHAGVRPHIRRAHWHTILSGARKRTDGSEIPPADRRRDLRWMPPIPVNLESVDNLPAVIRRA